MASYKLKSRLQVSCAEYRVLSLAGLTRHILKSGFTNRTGCVTITVADKKQGGRAGVA
jgi:hypothetical protein